MNPHSENLNALLKRLGVDSSGGLSTADAARKLTEDGPNRLAEKKGPTMLQRFLAQFKDAMIVILLVAAAISFYLALQGHDAKEFFEPALILLIVLLNAIMGTVQESRAEKSLEALKKLSAPHARVLRDGVETVIDAADLVCGDIILVEAGDFVPADARLIESANLKVEESALTGESVPSEKDASLELADDAPLGDRKNMIYSGCSVTYGRGRAVVTATGMSTEVGKIAGLLAGEKEEGTPLQKKLAKLGRYLGVMAIAICAVIFVIGLIDGMKAIDIFMVSVSLAVSAIPEGLPAIVTIVLSIGVTRMVKRNAIIRKLPAVETLGGASVICSDKTGTLTQNRMTLVRALDLITGEDAQITPDCSPSIRALLEMGALCCDGSVTVENGTEKHIGDPTETSIVAAALKNGMPKEQLNQTFPRVAEAPFDSDRKRMSVVVKRDGKYQVIVKGGFDTVAPLCVAGNITAAGNWVTEVSAQAIRVLAVAVKELDQLPGVISPETLECDLTMVGLVGMIDPPREEARVAVARCREAGIKPVMITGDHVLTASAIARQLGIQLDGDDAITGAELAQMSEEDLDKRVRTISVYARVSPEDKIRIVKAWQKQGEIVAMTGDGVNDAPALKAADIGCAMGITGTDVAKGAADMTLTDDNFATIVHAVEEGRGIYANIQKAVVFLLGTNIGEVLTTLIAMLMWKEAPFLSMQLLWINLVTDSLPAIALGMEAVESDVMKQKPRPKTEGLFAHGRAIQIALYGLMFSVLTLFAFQWGRNHTGLGLEGGRTLAFLVMGMLQVIHAFNMRSNRSLFQLKPFSNRNMNLAALASTAMMALVLFVPPVAEIFGLIMLPARFYLVGLGLSFVPVVILEIFKALGLLKNQ